MKIVGCYYISTSLNTTIYPGMSNLSNTVYRGELARVDLMVRENIELLMEMVGLKMLMGGTPGLFSIMAWLPETIKRGKTTEKTQPAITWKIFQYFSLSPRSLFTAVQPTWLSGMLVMTASGSPNPRK